MLLLAGLASLANGCQSDTRSKPEITSHSNMQHVAGATYRMGSDPGDLERIKMATGIETTALLMAEVPSREVTVASFYIDKYDVINQQFMQFVQALPAWSKEHVDVRLHNGRYLEHWVSGSPPPDLMDHPVTFVPWYGAVAYCDWLGKRLPTEAEYEWAAQDAASASEYPWGNRQPDSSVVNWSGSGIQTTVSVGSYAPNTRGLYDMSGNVWHFTSDPWLGSYAEMSASSAIVEDLAQRPDARKVVRGGSWGANAANLRIRYRDSHRANDAREMVGFRCARSVKPPH